MTVWKVKNRPHSAFVATGLVPRAHPPCERQRREKPGEQWQPNDMAFMSAFCRDSVVAADGECALNKSKPARSGMSSAHAETAVLTASGRMQRPRDANRK
jgi:hypothetical protein